VSDHETVCGVAVVDKPVGPTSHDVVGRSRRLLGTRRVGHAGTLDPMASGVLVILAGEATKLASYLTAHDKRYEARVAFGLATDTLDAEGSPTRAAEPPAWLREDLARLAEGRDPAEAPRIFSAIEAERARTAQTPPAFSAIQVGGVRSYDRARAGEAVELDDRPVEVRSLRVIGASAEGDGPYVDLEVAVSKGYYVRSLARDLGDRLGVPAHLARLRRTASGPFTLEEAVALDDLRPERLVSLDASARRALPTGTLAPSGELRARRGQRLAEADFLHVPPIGPPSAWLDGEGRLVALGTRQADGFTLLRGFAGDEPAGSPAPGKEPGK
jgi:tRNA pseudouridine55 synthase